MTKPCAATRTKSSFARRRRTARGRSADVPMEQVRDKELAFAREFAMDWNKTQAAIRAGYSKASARQIGYELLKKPYIQNLVREVQRERAERLNLDNVWLKDQLQDCYAAAREKGDLKSAVKALESLGKLTGAFEKHNHQKQGIKSDAEAAAIREKLKQRGMTFETINEAYSSN